LLRGDDDDLLLALGASLHPDKLHRVAAYRYVLPKHGEVQELGYHVPCPGLRCSPKRQLLQPLLYRHRGNARSSLILPPWADVKVNQALVCCLCGVPKDRKLFHHVAVYDRAQRGRYLAPECPGIERGELTLHGHADIALCRIHWGRRMFGPSVYVCHPGP
jgi:hypothetical protein